MLCCHFFSHACTTTAAPAEATCCLVMLWRVIAKRTLVFCCLFKVERCLCLTPTHSLDLSCLGDCDNKAACASISLRIKQLKRQSTWGQRRAARMNKNKTKQPPPPPKKNAQHGKDPAKPSQSRLHKQKKRDVVLVAGDMPGPPASCCSIDCKTEETQLLDDKAGVRRI